MSLNTFVTQLVESGVVSQDVVERLQSEASPASAEEFARSLIALKQLTPYQARNLLAGKGRGLLLGNYVILDKLGQGGMGMVLKAHHRRMDRIVALKVLSPHLVKSNELVSRFHREVKAAAKLSHPSIVMAFDADEARGTHFLVMEYVEGSDLSDVVDREGPLAIPQAVSYVVQAAEGLAFAHLHGVVHRDIKPANLLLGRNGFVKILDMGLARIEGETGTNAQLTGSGAVMGTVDYMAPEQALSSKRADARSDIYSLGITLWYLLTGRPAFDGDSLMARLLAHRESPVPSLRTARQDIPSKLDDVFRKMIAKRPEDRFSSMPEVLEALVPFDTLAQANERPADAASSRTVKQPRRRNVAALLDAEKGSRSETVLERPSPGGSRLSGATRVPTFAGSRRFLFGGLAVLLLAGALTTALLLASRSWTTHLGDNRQGGAGEVYGRPDHSITPQGSSPSLPSPPLDGARRSALTGVAGLRFDGAESHVDVAALSLDASKPYTVEFWGTPTDLPGGSVVKLHGPIGFSLWRGLTYANWGTLALPGPASTAGPTVAQTHTRRITIDQRQHVAMTFEPSTTTIRIFLDGSDVGSSVYSVPIEADRRDADAPKEPGAFTIGAFPRARTYYFGTIDELRVSQSIRYPGAFYPEDTFSKDPSTVLLFHFDERSGDVLTDSSGRGQHGRIVGAKWVEMPR
ncbi:Serine/threonine-protein kinase PknB [Planctomyces sp. SH-PL14]|nr:Serine/threonine-protein kinase PknB [Planctomyces sp. SH-PL14]